MRDWSADTRSPLLSLETFLLLCVWLPTDLWHWSHCLNSCLSLYVSHACCWTVGLAILCFIINKSRVLSLTVVVFSSPLEISQFSFVPSSPSWFRIQILLLRWLVPRCGGFLSSSGFILTLLLTVIRGGDTQNGVVCCQLETVRKASHLPGAKSDRSRSCW